MQKTGLYPPELPSINIDAEWPWRRLVPALAARLHAAGRQSWHSVAGAVLGLIGALAAPLGRLYNADGLFARTWSAGASALAVVLILLAYLLLYLSRG